MLQRRFEELADVCDAHNLDLQLHAAPRPAKARKAPKRFQLGIEISDGAEGVTTVHVGEAEGLDVAAFEALTKLRKAGVVP